MKSSNSSEVDVDPLKDMGYMSRKDSNPRGPLKPRHVRPARLILEGELYAVHESLGVHLSGLTLPHGAPVAQLLLCYTWEVPPISLSSPQTA